MTESPWVLVGFFVTAFVVGLSGAVMPGPVTTVTMGHVARRGLWAGPLVSSGHAIVEGLLVTTLALGAATFLNSPVVTGVIAVMGAAVLFWMGYSMVGEGRKGDAPAKPNVGKSPLGPVAGGMLASVFNPYWFVWWSTVGVGYFAMVRQWGALGVVTFFLGHVLADFAWLTVVALALTGGRSVMSDQVLQRLFVALGVFLVFMGAGFLVFGMGRLLGVGA